MIAGHLRSRGPGRRRKGWSSGLPRLSGWNRRDWPTSLLRRIWETLMEVEPGRRRSQVHEARWLNLLGFRLAARLRAGGRRLAGGRDLAAAAGQPGPPHGHVPRRVVDPLAADRRRTGGRPAAGPGRSALIAPIRALHRQLVTGKGRGGDFSFPAATRRPKSGGCWDRWNSCPPA